MNRVCLGNIPAQKTRKLVLSTTRLIIKLIVRHLARVEFCTARPPRILLLLWVYNDYCFPANAIEYTVLFLQLFESGSNKFAYLY